MECKEFSSRIDAYLDGELSGEQEQAFLAHAKKCSACNARLKAAQEAIALTRALRSKAPDFITPALEKISKEKKRKQMRRVGFAGVAAALLLCCISAIMLQYIGKGADQQNSASGSSGWEYGRGWQFFFQHTNTGTGRKRRCIS